MVGIPMRNGNFVQSALLLPTIISLCPSLSLSGTAFTKAHWDPGAIGETRLGGTSSSFLPRGGPAIASAPLHFSFLSFSSFRIPTPSLI